MGERRCFAVSAHLTAISLLAVQTITIDQLPRPTHTIPFQHASAEEKPAINLGHLFAGSRNASRIYREFRNIRWVKDANALSLWSDSQYLYEFDWRPFIEPAGGHRHKHKRVKSNRWCRQPQF